MKARLCALALAALSMSVSPAAFADNNSNNVSWKRVIGIIQAGNIVGNIAGGGQPWSTLGGEANVNLRSGRVEFEVRGLVLAGGNSIGTPDAINQVKRHDCLRPRQCNPVRCRYAARVTQRSG